MFEYAAHTSFATWSRYLMFAARAVEKRPLQLQANFPNFALGISARKQILLSVGTGKAAIAAEAQSWKIR
jgi:hypothetical protein